jgi:hypothetical protein
MTRGPRRARIIRIPRAIRIGKKGKRAGPYEREDGGIKPLYKSRAWPSQVKVVRDVRKGAASCATTRREDGGIKPPLQLAKKRDALKRAPTTGQGGGCRRRGRRGRGGGRRVRWRLSGGRGRGCGRKSSAIFFPFLLVAFHAAGDQVAVGVAAQARLRHDVVQAHAGSPSKSPEKESCKS